MVLTFEDNEKSEALVYAFAKVHKITAEMGRPKFSQNTKRQVNKIIENSAQFET